MKRARAMFLRSFRRAALPPDGGPSASSGAVASALRDAFYLPPARPGAFDRWARALINDPRDVPFVHLALSASLCVFPVAAWLFYQRRFPWWVGAIYLAALFLTVVDRFVLMLRRRLWRGELSFWALCALLCLYSWPATLVVFIAPVVIVRVLMMCGNWGQHALIDPRAPENCYRNSITCIDSRYNRRCFNDGYHIGHHVKASMHWTDMPGEFVRNRNIYATERAIAFQKIDFFSCGRCS
jgi:fatty acid desaturase